MLDNVNHNFSSVQHETTVICCSLSCNNMSSLLFVVNKYEKNKQKTGSLLTGQCSLSYVYFHPLGPRGRGKSVGLGF